MTPGESARGPLRDAVSLAATSQPVKGIRK